MIVPSAPINAGERLRNRLPCLTTTKTTCINPTINKSMKSVRTLALKRVAAPGGITQPTRMKSSSSLIAVAMFMMVASGSGKSSLIVATTVRNCGAASAPVALRRTIQAAQAPLVWRKRDLVAELLHGLSQPAAVRRYCCRRLEIHPRLMQRERCRRPGGRSSSCRSTTPGA